MAVAALGCNKAISVDCATKMRDVAAKDKNAGATFTVSCPANCAGGVVRGTDTYTTDSSVCMAAIHAGVIAKDTGGNVKVLVVKGLDKYAGSERNGVKSDGWKVSWGDTAFQVAK
ncbi:MAG TPA: LCCL domain-containing protein [Spirochaetota bacterium]|nr:LCCL domain-containing protein [Spirochaetota bacterium]HPC41891.1 LCCL domain-containing protein [Spirochaetota bacterium]HPL17178.1 LCCL domain-containing protein [Spirochaetota bacterium]HQF09602.1 LCCL domain-containing protein [Spirochaetota bacterium]HQH98328.1 LCCL domain-containing protein [Spirochaetota bacterium]